MAQNSARELFDSEEKLVSQVEEIADSMAYLGLQEEEKSHADQGNAFRRHDSVLTPFYRVAPLVSNRSSQSWTARELEK